MPREDERPTNTPDPSESRERAVPEKEAGLGKVNETRNTPVADPERQETAREQSEKHRERTADDIMDGGEGVSPTDVAAHGGRRGASEAEATGKVRRSEAERDAERRGGGKAGEH